MKTMKIVDDERLFGAGLTPIHRSVLTLRLDGLSLAEVARRLDVSGTRAMKCEDRARALLVLDESCGDIVDALDAATGCKAKNRAAARVERAADCEARDADRESRRKQLKVKINFGGVR